jgi:CHAT domain-containing protein/tetratricopeptide (TPR) repeat protein
MSLTFRVSLCWLALSLSFISPASSLFQSLASTPSSSQSSDEEILRKMTEQYGLAIAAGDIETMRGLWNPQSPNLASRLRYYQGNIRYEFIRMKVSRLEVTGDKAVSYLTTDERRLDRKIGTILSNQDAFHDVCRSVEWIKTGGGWKIEREFSVQDELAGRLEAASESERDAILEKEKAFVTDLLIQNLLARGQTHRARGDFDAALRCYQLGQAVAEKIGDQAGMAGAWMYFGMLKATQGYPEQALPFQQKALALYAALGLKRGEALVLEKLSRLYFAFGDHQPAFDCAQKSLRLFEETNHRRGMVAALSVLADIYENQRNFQQALAYTERALAIAEEIEDKVYIATSRHGVGFYHQELGDYERALEIYQELLKQIEGFGDRVGAAAMRVQIGSVFAEQGRYAEALDYHRQALPEIETASETLVKINAIRALVYDYLGLGKYAEALPLAERAVALSRQTANQFELWGALTDLGYCQLGLNRPLEARQAFDEAVSVIEKLRAQTAGGVEEQVRYFENRLSAHHGILSLLVRENRTREALVFAERAKARALLDVLQHGRVGIQKAMTVAEQEQEHRLKAEMIRLNTQLARAMQADAPDAQQTGAIKSQLEKARLNYEAFQDSLYTAHPKVKVQRGQAPIINAEEMTALLPDAITALLEYVVTDDKLYLFAITKAAEKAEAEIKVYTLGIKRDELARQTEAFRRQLASRDLGFRASATKLYDLLLKPAAAQLQGKTNLIIAPDDTLWDLPFQALLVGANRFLIEDAAIAYTPSLTALREMTRRHKNQSADGASTTLLALGNPLVEKETVNRAALTLRNGKLGPLPEAEQEVKALGRLYGVSQSKVYIGIEAREDRIKREAGQARILHFAAHGMLNNASPMYSHLALAQGGAGEDGLLEAWELMQLDLKADLAVLSACETARGRIGAGEGMIGLSWAMFIAGVPSIVVSQWKVESAGTRDLMVSFHRALISQPEAGKTKTTKTEALRQAALKLMKNAQTSHPFYWAGFVLVGDGR